MATYALIGLVFIALALIAAWLCKIKSKRAALFALFFMAIVTLHIEPIMINLGLYEHDSSKLVGIELRTIPIEDFMYVVFAALVIPALWDYFSPKK